jgi:hypothetical protein
MRFPVYNLAVLYSTCVNVQLLTCWMLSHQVQFPIWRYSCVSCMFIDWNGVLNAYDPNLYSLWTKFFYYNDALYLITSKVTSNAVDISHQHAVNSRYLLYIYCHLIILSFITHALTPVSHPHLTLWRHILTVLIPSSSTSDILSVCMDCVGKIGATIAKTYQRARACKALTSWIQTCWICTLH